MNIIMVLVIPGARAGGMTAVLTDVDTITIAARHRHDVAEVIMTVTDPRALPIAGVAAEVGVRVPVMNVPPAVAEPAKRLSWKGLHRT